MSGLWNICTANISKITTPNQPIVPKNITKTKVDNSQNRIKTENKLETRLNINEIFIDETVVQQTKTSDWNGKNDIAQM